MKSPVHRLPPEVLALIFSKLIEIESPLSFIPDVKVVQNQRYGPIHSVSLVSRTWRNAAFAFPGLWSTTCTSKSAVAFRHFERSKNADLRVFITAGATLENGWTAYQEPSNFTSLMDALSTHASRIHQLHIFDADEGSLRATSLMTTPLLFLDSLTIAVDSSSQRNSWSSDPGSRWSPDSIFGGLTPRLREVTLLRCPPFPGQGFGHLSRLFIAQGNGAHHVSHLLDILRSSPALEELGIVSVEFFDHALGSQKVILNHLRVLTLGRWGHSTITLPQFLDMLIIPHPINLLIWGMRLESNLDLPHIFPLYLTVQADSLKTLRITLPRRTRSRHRNTSFRLWRRSYFHAVISNETELQVDGAFEPDQFLFDAPQLLNLAHLQELWLGASYHADPTPTEWHSFFSALPSLATLVISRRSSYPIISALILPKDHPNQSKLLCPNLSILRIFADDTLSILRLAIFLDQRDRMDKRLSLFELLSNGRPPFESDGEYIQSDGPSTAPWPPAMVSDLIALEQYVDRVEYSKVVTDRNWDVLDSPALDWVHRLWP